MLKKIFLSFFVALYLLTHIATPAKADTWFNQEPLNWFKKVHDTTISPEPEIFGERYTAAQVQWIFYSVLSFPLTLLGQETVQCIFSPDLTCLEGIISNITAEANKYPEFLANQNKSFTETLFADRPLSGITYVRSQLRRLEIIPTANAQQAGFGFSALDPILNMWQGMRNTAYVFLILATLILAFMIMFRVKVSPQVVVTVQSAIPKLVTAIILVTFSYAIAGFLIDIMYVVIGLVSLTLGVPFNVLTTFPFLLSFALYVGLFMLTAAVVLVVTFGFVFSGAGVLAGIALLAIPGVNAIFAIILLLVVLLVLILLIIHFFRTLFMLIKAFANILLLVIFAPLQFVAGTLVESLGFNSWLRSFVSNLAVFVVTGILLALSYWFLIQAMASAFRAFASEDLLHSLANVFWGNLVVNTVTRESIGWPPLLGWGSDSGVALVMLGASFVVFTLIPRTTEVVQGLISGRQFAYGSAIGETAAVPGQILSSVGSMAKTGEAIGSGINNVDSFIRRLQGKPPRPTGQQVLSQPNTP